MSFVLIQLCSELVFLGKKEVKLEPAAATCS